MKGGACRYKSIWLKSKFTSPLVAEAQYSTNALPSKEYRCSSSQTLTEECSSCSMQTEVHGMTGNGLDPLSAVWGMLDGREQVMGLSALFSRYCDEQFECTVPDDFLLYAAPAMSQLSVSHRSNVLYNLAKGLSCMRADKSDSLFPTKRMPMGLLEFMANFFVSSESRKVSDV